jgi:hypothetical protein
MQWKSGGGPPQSKTLARGMKRPANAKRLGLLRRSIAKVEVRQSSGAFGLVRERNWRKDFN